MSARDDLMSALWDNYTTAEKNQFIDAFAHALAEKIKSEGHPTSGQVALGLFYAADLIDPEVKP